MIMLRRNRLLLALVFPTVVRADGFAEFVRTALDFLDPGPLLDPIFDSAAQATCNAIEDATNVDDLINCGCDSNIRFFSESTVSAECKLAKPLCLVPIVNLFCGDGATNIEYAFVRNDIKSVKSCFDLKSGIPVVDQAIDFLEFCIESDPKPARLTTNQFKFDGCTMSLGGETCQSCNVCNDERSFSFDCTNVPILSADVLGNPVNIPGPQNLLCSKIDSLLKIGDAILGR